MTEKQLAGMSAALKRWLNTREFGQICVRASGNAAERECRHAAERLGFVWLKFWVNHEEDAEGQVGAGPAQAKDHCLYSMCRPGQRPIRHRAIGDATWKRLCEEVGWELQTHLERTDEVVEGLRTGRRTKRLTPEAAAARLAELGWTGLHAWQGSGWTGDTGWNAWARPVDADECWGGKRLGGFDTRWQALAALVGFVEATAGGHSAEPHTRPTPTGGPVGRSLRVLVGSAAAQGAVPREGRLF